MATIASFTLDLCNASNAVKMLRNLAIIFVAVFCFSLKANAQEFSKNSIKIGVGVAGFEGDKLDGSGLVAMFGFQREMRDGLSFSPFLKHGTYTTMFYNDTPDIYFNVTSTGIGLNASILKLFYIGAGGEIYYAHGLIGTGGEFSKASHYERDFGIDMYAFAGLRIAPKSKRIAINVIPISVAWGIDNTMSECLSADMRIEMDIKLTK